MDNSLHTIKKMEKRIKKFDYLKFKVKQVKLKLENSEILDKEEKENLNYSIDYILYIIDKYKTIEKLDI